MNTAYARGVIETLVKAGEISPAYAHGVMSGLEKQAFVGRLLGGAARLGGRALWGATKGVGKGLWGATKFTARHPVGVGATGLGTYGSVRLLSDSPMVNLEQERDRIFAGRGSNYRPSEQEAAEAVDRSRHWWHYSPTWALNWLKNRGAKLMSRFDPANGRTPDSYDREWEKFKAQDRADYIREYLDNDDLRNTLRTLAAAQSHNNNEINAYWTDTKRYMTPGARRFLGYPDRPRNTSYGPVGRAVIAGGLYKPKYDYDAPAPRRPTYGMGLPELGSTNDLYVRRRVH